MVFDAFQFAGFGALDSGGHSTAFVLFANVVGGSIVWAKRICATVYVGGMELVDGFADVAIGQNVACAPKRVEVGGSVGRFLALDGLLCPRSTDV